MAELHDISDGDYWRGLSPREVLDLVQQQLAESYEDTASGVVVMTPQQVIRDALATVTEDVFDRADDMTRCNKADGCCGAAVFLAWLSWRIDDGLMAQFARAAADRAEGQR